MANGGGELGGLTCKYYTALRHRTYFMHNQCAVSPAPHLADHATTIKYFGRGFGFRYAGLWDPHRIAQVVAREGDESVRDILR